VHFVTKVSLYFKKVKNNLAVLAMQIIVAKDNTNLTLAKGILDRWCCHRQMFQMRGMVWRNTIAVVSFFIAATPHTHTYL
jgi:hypothetical protein